MRTTLDKLESSHLTLNESAWLRCQAAVELKDRGDYEGAREVMRPFWKHFGERPKIEGLNPPDGCRSSTSRRHSHAMDRQ